MFKKILLVLLLASTFVFAQGKSKGTAAALSIPLPGLGHVYAGEVNSGFTTMGIWAGSLGLTVAYGPWTWEKAASSDDPFAEFNEGTPTSIKVIWGASAALTLGTWIYSIVDAPKAIDRQNKLSLNVMPTMDSKGILLSAKINF